MINRQKNGSGLGKIVGPLVSAFAAAIIFLLPGYFAGEAGAQASERVYVVPAPAQTPQYVQPVPAPQYRYKYRYVTPRNWYGQRRSVPNAYEAARIIGQYYPGLRIGPIIERDLFFQADIRDRRGVLVDKVIIDKRTGRMRSIY
jgi:hypothetical protein